MSCNLLGETGCWVRGGEGRVFKVLIWWLVILSVCAILWKRKRPVCMYGPFAMCYVIKEGNFRDLSANLTPPCMSFFLLRSCSGHSKWLWSCAAFFSWCKCSWWWRNLVVETVKGLWKTTTHLLNFTHWGTKKTREKWWIIQFNSIDESLGFYSSRSS